MHIYLKVSVGQESGHGLTNWGLYFRVSNKTAFKLQSVLRSHLKIRMQKNLLPRSFVWLLAGFSFWQAQDCGPHFLFCHLEVTLNSLPHGPFHKAVHTTAACFIESQQGEESVSKMEVTILSIIFCNMITEGTCITFLIFQSGSYRPHPT